MVSLSSDGKSRQTSPQATENRSGKLYRLLIRDDAQNLFVRFSSSRIVNELQHLATKRSRTEFPDTDPIVAISEEENDQQSFWKIPNGKDDGSSLDPSLAFLPLEICFEGSGDHDAAVRIYASYNGGLISHSSNGTYPLCFAMGRMMKDCCS